MNLKKAVCFTPLINDTNDGKNAVIEINQCDGFVLMDIKCFNPSLKGNL